MQRLEEKWISHPRNICSQHVLRRREEKCSWQQIRNMQFYKLFFKLPVLTNKFTSLHALCFPHKLLKIPSCFAHCECFYLLHPPSIFHCLQSPTNPVFAYIGHVLQKKPAFFCISPWYNTINGKQFYYGRTYSCSVLQNTSYPDGVSGSIGSIIASQTMDLFSPRTACYRVG